MNTAIDLSSLIGSNGGLYTSSIAQHLQNPLPKGNIGNNIFLDTLNNALAASVDGTDTATQDDSLLQLLSTINGNTLNDDLLKNADPSLAINEKSKTVDTQTSSDLSANKDLLISLLSIIQQNTLNQANSINYTDLTDDNFSSVSSIEGLASNMQVQNYLYNNIGQLVSNLYNSNTTGTDKASSNSMTNTVTNNVLSTEGTNSTSGTNVTNVNEAIVDESLLLNTSNDDTNALILDNVNNNQANVVSTTAKASVEANETKKDTFTTRKLPNEIMENINAARSIRDQIRAAINRNKQNLMEQSNSVSSYANTNEAGKVLNQIAPNNSDILNNEALATSTNIPASTIQNEKTIELKVDENALKFNKEEQLEQIVFKNSKDYMKPDKEFNDNLIIKEVASIETPKVNIGQASKAEATIELNNNKKADDKIELNDDISVNNDMQNVNGMDINRENKIITVSDESSKIRDNVMTQIKDQILIAKQDGKQTVSMQLLPEKLGKLDIKMVFEKGTLSVEILAENPKTQSLIMSNISELKSLLQNSVDNKSIINVDVPKQYNEESLYHNNQDNESRQQNQQREQNQFTQNNDEAQNDEFDFMTELTKLRSLQYGTIDKI